MMNKPQNDLAVGCPLERRVMPLRCLDLFCCGGGAGMGYHLAGMDVTGVDIDPQPKYPFTFVQGDALEYLAAHGHEFDFIHASPPCQGYSVLKRFGGGDTPKLIGAVRELLQRSGKPWVIENVQGARQDMINPIMLCGSSFGLGVRRHRIFETNPPIALVPACAHHAQPEPVDVTGTGSFCKKPRTAPRGGLSRKPKNIKEARDVMGIQWLGRKELSQAVPPAFTRYIAEQMMGHNA
jgi:DNA (cytosine-5)-methyltransferase 1